MSKESILINGTTYTPAKLLILTKTSSQFSDYIDDLEIDIQQLKNKLVLKEESIQALTLKAEQQQIVLAHFNRITELSNKQKEEEIKKIHRSYKNKIETLRKELQEKELCSTEILLLKERIEKYKHIINVQLKALAKYKDRYRKYKRELHEQKQEKGLPKHLKQKIDQLEQDNDALWNILYQSKLLNEDQIKQLQANNLGKNNAAVNLFSKLVHQLKAQDTLVVKSIELKEKQKELHLANEKISALRNLLLKNGVKKATINKHITQYQLLLQDEHMEAHWHELRKDEERMQQAYKNIFLQMTLLENEVENKQTVLDQLSHELNEKEAEIQMLLYTKEVNEELNVKLKKLVLIQQTYLGDEKQKNIFADYEKLKENYADMYQKHLKLGSEHLALKREYLELKNEKSKHPPQQEILELKKITKYLETKLQNQHRKIELLSAMLPPATEADDEIEQ